MAKLPRPEGHHSITPSFVVTGAANVITFLEKAFDAKVVDRYAGENTIMHAEVMIGDSVVMCGDPPSGWTESPGVFAFYVDDGPAVDTTYKRALDAGATSLEPPKDQPWGYRSASVKDVAGNRWTITAVIEQLTRDELQKRMQKLMSGG